jgi:hypothetical protein
MRRHEQRATALLVRARRRIADPARWVRFYLATDATGRRVQPTAPEAARWCAVGALQAEAGWRAVVHGGQALRQATVRLYEACGRTPEYVNDERGHAAVLEMYDEAIRRK